MNHKLIKLSNEINTLIDSNKNKYIIRNKKTTMHDGLMYRLLYTQKDSTQTLVTAKINNFLGKSINRSSYSDRDKQINIEFYEKLNKLININTDKNKKLHWSWRIKDVKLCKYILIK